MHSFYQLHFITDKYIFNNFIVHFALIFYLHKVLFSYKEKNELIKSSNSNNTLMVRVKGLEPPWITPLDPKSSASTNSAIPANKRL